jgi:hypothetical protein
MNLKKIQEKKKNSNFQSKVKESNFQAKQQHENISNIKQKISFSTPASRLDAKSSAIFSTTKKNTF